MGADPEFPNRPDTDDFRRLCDVVVGLDNEADNGREVDDIVSEVIDPDSLTYMAEQRGLRAVPRFAEACEQGIDNGPPQVLALFAALWVDAFTAGARYASVKGGDN